MKNIEASPVPGISLVDFDVLLVDDERVCSPGASSTRIGTCWGQVTLLGEIPSDRIAGPEFGIWPSDHAGLVADLLLPGGAPIP